MPSGAENLRLSPIDATHRAVIATRPHSLPASLRLPTDDDHDRLRNVDCNSGRPTLRPPLCCRRLRQRVELIAQLPVGLGQPFAAVERVRAGC